MSVEAPAKKKAAAPRKPADHPKYIDMIKAAVASLKERNGSSRQAIAKYILANYKVGEVNPHLKMALKRGVASGAILQHKGTGASGSFKLNKAIKEEKKPKKKPVAKKAVKKPAAKKAKKPAAKKAKKPVAKKATPKKPAAKKAAKKPAAKKPVKAKKPVAKKPVAKKSPAKKAAKKPVKKPAASKKK